MSILERYLKQRELDYKPLPCGGFQVYLRRVMAGKRMLRIVTVGDLAEARRVLA